jgi:hypothetical protein
MDYAAGLRNAGLHALGVQAEIEAIVDRNSRAGAVFTWLSSRTRSTDTGPSTKTAPATLIEATHLRITAAQDSLLDLNQLLPYSKALWRLRKF